MNTDTTTKTDEKKAFSLPRGCTSPIDAQGFLVRCLNDPAFALVLLDEFESSIAQRIDEITLLSVSDDLQNMAEVAHSLKGAAAIVGAEEVRALATDIENAGRVEDPARLPHLIKNLRGEIQTCMNAIPHLRLQLQHM
ncbi:MAG: Hpt domain-containing protein [Planctomycetaceae bacterium]